MMLTGLTKDKRDEALEVLGLPRRGLRWDLDVPDREPFTTRLAALGIDAERRWLDVELARRAGALDGPRASDTKLSPAQAAGRNWLERTDMAILADEMGSGKTVQACTALNHHHRNVLIVCPASVVEHWAAHIKVWALRMPTILRGTPAQRRAIVGDLDFGAGCVVITTWDLLPKLVPLAHWPGSASAPRGVKPLDGIEFDLCIADEAHRAKNPRAQRSRALWGVLAKQRWALTGTPVAGSPFDLWSLLHWLDPEAWRSKTWFERRYCRTKPTRWGTEVLGFEHSTLAELKQSIEPIHRRMPMDVALGRDIKRVRSVRMVELTGDHAEQYRKLEREFLLACDGDPMPIHERTLVTRLTQCASAMLERNADDPDQIKMSARSPKAVDLLDILADTDKPIVVYSPSKQLILNAHAVLISEEIENAIFTGDTGRYERRDILRWFNAGNCRALLCTTGAAGEGIDLSAASTVVNLSQSWSIVESRQSEDRIRRWTQKRDQVNIIDIVARNTIDHAIRRVLARKAQHAADVTPREIAAELRG